ncbi:MAG: GNAT family N-acetyltransferase [Anaerolineales bacterium]
MVFHDETGWTEFPVLETERLILRQPKLSDADDVFVFSSDPVVQKYNAEPTTERSEAEEIIRSYNSEYERTEGVIWGITLSGVDTVIGMIGFHYWSVHNRATLGYDLAHEFWGRGIGSEAARRVLRFGFGNMGLNRIEAPTIEDNHESVRLLEKLGFTREGIRREYTLEDDGEYHNSAMYALLLSEYQVNE